MIEYIDDGSYDPYIPSSPPPPPPPPPVEPPPPPPPPAVIINIPPPPPPPPPPVVWTPPPPPPPPYDPWANWQPSPPPPPPPPPVDGTNFITSLFYSTLGRAPDAGGLAIQVASYNSYATQYGEVAAQNEFQSRFYNSSEAVGYRAAQASAAYAAAAAAAAAAQARKDGATNFLSGLYQSQLGRAPDAAGLQVELDAYLSYSSQNGDAAAQTEFTSRFYNSSEAVAYRTAQAAAVAAKKSAATEFLTGLYHAQLGRDPDAAGLQVELDAYLTYAGQNGDAAAKTEFASRFYNSSEAVGFRSAQAQRRSAAADFIGSLYASELGRQADAGGLAVQVDSFLAYAAQNGDASARTEFQSRFHNSGEALSHRQAIDNAFTTATVARAYDEILPDYHGVIESYLAAHPGSNSSAEGVDGLHEAVLNAIAEKLRSTSGNTGQSADDYRRAAQSLREDAIHQALGGILNSGAGGDAAPALGGGSADISSSGAAGVVLLFASADNNRYYGPGANAPYSPFVSPQLAKDTEKVLKQLGNDAIQRITDTISASSRMTEDKINDRIDATEKSLNNTLDKNLDPTSREGDLIERSGGETYAKKPNGDPYDHQNEVDEGLRALDNRQAELDRLKKDAGDKLTDEQKQRIEDIERAINETRDSINSARKEIDERKERGEPPLKDPRFDQNESPKENEPPKEGDASDGNGPKAADNSPPGTNDGDPGTQTADNGNSSDGSGASSDGTGTQVADGGGSSNAGSDGGGADGGGGDAGGGGGGAGGRGYQISAESDDTSAG